MAFTKCNLCGNHYSVLARLCPFCGSSSSLFKKIQNISAPPEPYCLEIEGTDLSEYQKKRVLEETAEIHRKGIHPRYNRAKAYIHDDFKWALYERWLGVFRKSTGLEQWPAAYAFSLFDELYEIKRVDEILSELTLKQLRNLAADEQVSPAMVCTYTKGRLVKKFLELSDQKRVRLSALAIIRAQLKDEANRERKELFSTWLFYAAALQEKVSDWREFNVERVVISPAVDSCHHCKKLKGKEVSIERVLPLLLQQHPGCRSDMVLAKSEFSRLT